MTPKAPIEAARRRTWIRQKLQDGPLTAFELYLAQPDEFPVVSRDTIRQDLHDGLLRQARRVFVDAAEMNTTTDNPQLRQAARFIRNTQRRFMERVRDVESEFGGPLWFCVWNKKNLPQLPDEERCGLLSGMDRLSIMEAHPEWFVEDEWDDARYACPIRLTDAGRSALNNWGAYDMGPVSGGLTEPGWVAVPTPVEEG